MSRIIRFLSLAVVTPGSVRRYAAVLTILALLSLLSVPGGREAEAATVTVDVCQTVLKQVLIPPTYQDIVTCNNEWYICAFVDPACCVPVVCNALPHCKITKQVVAVAAHLEDQWVVECHPENLDPAEEWEKWLRKQIPSLDDLLLPGAFDAAKLDIEAMKLSASPIPDGVKTQVLGLLQPFVASGKAKFTGNDVNNARILSNSNANASLYLRDGFGAITLYDLIVIRDNQFKILTNTAYHQYTVDQIKSGAADAGYVGALMLLVHELVHVHQYSGLGFDAFLTNYLIETITTGYGNDSFESEAYMFESDVEQSTAGLQSAELTEAEAVAEALGGCSKIVLADRTKWMKVTRSFKGCLAGKTKIRKADCAAAATKEFGLGRDITLCGPTIPTLGRDVIIKRPGDGKRVKTMPAADRVKVKTAQGKEIMVPVKTKALPGAGKEPGLRLQERSIESVPLKNRSGVTVRP